MTRKYTMEKLNDKNYRMWKLRMSLILERAQLIDIVNGKLLQPKTTPELDEWKNKDLDARMELVMHLTDEQIDLVKDLETSKEIWDALKERHEPSDRTTKINTLRHLVTLEMEESEGIDTFIRKWQLALEQALSAGNKIDEDMKFDLILGALPDSWDTFVTTHGNDDTSNMKNMFLKMKREEIRRIKGKAKHNDGSMAMSAITRFQKSNFSKPRFQKFQRSYKPNQPSKQGALNVSTITCRYCNKTGHMERECRRKQYDQRNKGKRYNAQAHSALIPNEEEDTSFIQAFMSEVQTNKIQMERLWYFDTGATHHLTHSREWLHNYKPLHHPLEVRFGDNGMKLALGKGTIYLSINNKSKITISNVYFVPGLAKNLLSVSEATSNGTIIEFHYNCAIIRYKLPTGDIIKTTCPKIGKLYPLKMMDHSPVEAYIASSHQQDDQTLIWHHRLGHLHPKSMKTIQTHKLVEGIPTKPFQYLSICEGCIYGKQSRRKFPHHIHQTERALQIVHSDLCGPLQIPSITGNRYFITFIDDFTRFTIIYFMKSKAGAFNAFKTYKALAENQCQSQIKTIRTDNGGEYCSTEWKTFCKTQGIRHEFTTSYNPQQNGVAERKNRTLLDASRSMLQVAGLQNKFWQEAISTACYLQNRSPHKVLGLNTPFSLWFGRKPNVGHLKIFGAIAYSHIPPKLRKKLDPHSIKCIMVGYGESEGIKGYKLFNPQNK